MSDEKNDTQQAVAPTPLGDVTGNGAQGDAPDATGSVAGSPMTAKVKAVLNEHWNRSTQCVSDSIRFIVNGLRQARTRHFAALVRLLILVALLGGGGKTLCTFQKLVGGIDGTKTASTKQRVIAAPSGELITSTSGILKLLIGPSTNSIPSSQESEIKPAGVELLPIERTERRPVVLPYIASLAACVTVLCAFIWGIVRIWREDV